MTDELENRLTDLLVNANDWDRNPDAITRAILDRGYTIVENPRKRLDEATPVNQSFRPGFNIRVAHPDLDEVPKGGRVPEQRIDCKFGDDDALTSFIFIARG